MFNYNDENIFVGYIKQLLSSFNYPDIDIYSDNIIPVEGNMYLKDNKIQLYKNSSWKEQFSYIENKYIANLTKKLENNSLIYDSHTHIWLGDYLRFLRDYKNFNLMSLYNCFTNESASNLYIENKEKGILFDSRDSNYKIYKIPVKLFQSYSLYIGCPIKIELLCSFGSELTSIQSLTYKRIYNSSFSNPVIIDFLSKEKLVNNEDLSSYYNKRKNLNLYLKIPSSNNSSIVILEGIYNNYSNYKLNKSKNASKMIFNHSVNNYEYLKEDKLNDLFISPLELTYINSKISHPFSDRLIEYLCNNVISPLDKVDDNIKRIQKLLVERFNSYKDDTHTKLGIPNYTNYGRWEPKMRNALYDISLGYDSMLNPSYSGTIKDSLGYVDKDVESVLGGDIDIYGGNDL